MASALITGGTSGIGHAFALEFANRGLDLVLVARDTARLEAVAAELRELHGIDVEIIGADLSQLADMKRVAARIEDPARPLDWVVNNAGFGLHSTVLNADEVEKHAKAIDLMCIAVLVLGGAAGRAMSTRGSGHIINVASTSASIFTGNYSAIKAWARTYSTGLALELKGTGVSVTALLPGWVKTEFHGRAGINATNLPNFVWIEPHKLVRACLADAEKGRIESIPDWKWKAAMFVADHGPRGITRFFSAKLTASRKRP